MKLDPGHQESLRTSVFSRMLEMYRDSGNWAASVQAYKKWNDKVKAKLGGNTNYAGLQADLLVLEPRLAGVIFGAEKPDGAKQAYQFAQLACFQQRFAAATRLFNSTLTEAPGIHQATRYRPHPAASAARAGTGQGLDIAPPKEQADFRKLALKWLWADLRVWKAKITAQQKLDARRTYRLWLDLDDFAPLRDASGLAKLPAEERQEWAAFWTEVRAAFSPRRARLRKGSSHDAAPPL